MSLASHLLKHLVITKYCNVPWSESKISRDPRGKPCFISEDSTSNNTIDFNVSHQAGIVSLIASIGFKEKVHVGTDVVCVNERLKQDYSHIDKSGFFDWVDMHEDVFAKSELQHMKLSPMPVEVDGKEVELTGYGKDALSRCQWRNVPIKAGYLGSDGTETIDISGDVVIDKKLRMFYAMWCVRETYVKMTGEALLAPWLKDLEIKDVQPPAAAHDIRDQNSLEVGESKNSFPIFFKGRRTNDVEMELTALGPHYMIGGAVWGPRGVQKTEFLANWVSLDIYADVLEFAESHM